MQRDWCLHTLECSVTACRCHHASGAEVQSLVAAGRVRIIGQHSAVLLSIPTTVHAPMDRPCKTYWSQQTSKMRKMCCRRGCGQWFDTDSPRRLCYTHKPVSPPTT